MGVVVWHSYQAIEEIEKRKVPAARFSTKEHVKKQYFEDINHQLAGLGLGANTNLPDFVPLTAGMQDVIRIQETIQIIKQ